MNRLVRWLMIPTLGLGMVTVSGAAEAAPAPVAVQDESIAYVEMGVIEEIYDVEGVTLQKTVTTPTQILPYSEDNVISSDDPATVSTPDTDALNRVTVHGTSGCHRIRGFVTGYGAITGTVQWRYWNRTYSCWNKIKRLVYNVSNHVEFTNVSNVWSVTHNLLDSARYFYNPSSSWDPFPLPGLNSRSAYYNWSKGEIEGTCGIVVQAACWMRPWVTIKSLYNGNWMVKGSNGTVRRG